MIGPDKKKLTIKDPVYSGREFLSLWEYVLKYGSNIDIFFDGITIPRYRLLSENEWFDIHTTTKIWENYRKCLDDFNMTDTFDIGCEQIRNAAFGITKTIAQFSSIKFIIKKIPYLARTVSKIDLMRVLEINRESAFVEYTVFPGFEKFIDSSHIFTFLGIFASLPTIHNMPQAEVKEVASLINIKKKFSVDFSQFNHTIEEKKGDLYLNGERAGRRIAINSETNLNPLVYKYLKNESCILWEKDIFGTKKNGETILIAQKGDLYNCSKTLFDIKWQNPKLRKRIQNSFSTAKQYSLAFFKSRDELLKQTSALQEHSNILEEKVRERTVEIHKAQSKIIELEKRSIEHRMTGGFAHEMRNALAGAQLQCKSISDYDGKGKNSTELLMNAVTDLSKNIIEVHKKYDIPSQKIKTEFIPHLRLIYEISEHLSDAVSDISKDIKRGLSITNQIRQYTKIYDFKPGNTPVDIVQMLKGYKHQKYMEFKKNKIEYIIDFDKQTIVKGNEIHLNSIFTNLILNAKDALCERQGSHSEIKIQIKNSQNYIFIIIKDNGIGIEENNLTKIFQPFFSTKPTSGTGLGLGIVKRLIKLYNGKIEVESKLGIGTSFTIILPKV
jgi:signal transduction histidine kinase